MSDTQTTTHQSSIRKLMGSKTYRPRCACGWEGSNSTKGQATKRADQHEKTGK